MHVRMIGLRSLVQLAFVGISVGLEVLASFAEGKTAFRSFCFTWPETVVAAALVVKDVSFGLLPEGSPSPYKYEEWYTSNLVINTYIFKPG